MNRDHILSEIRRTATTNSGVPLGRSRFRDETGIKESDWSGRFWSRWSDAVKEAGFEPNELQSKLSDDELLLAFASLIEKLGHIPTHPEVRLHARANPGFPSHNTFARFGAKEALLARVHGLAAALPDKFPLALALCEPHAPISDSQNDEDEIATAEAPFEFGFVYLMRSAGHYKIGRTNAIGRRERELAIQLPEKVRTVHSIKTDDPAGIEEYWHKRFASTRKNGEWFELSPEDVAAFRRRKFM
jgi:hypothetical protein